MMGERRVMQAALFYGFSLERHVPSDHLLRKSTASSSFARDCLAASDPEGVAAPISTGSKIEPSLPPGSGVRACLRHVKSRLCATPCRRATSHTTAPGISASSTIRAFSSLFQRRRRSTPRTFPSISA
jgi:hypothetical protein